MATDYRLSCIKTKTVKMTNNKSYLLVISTWDMAMPINAMAHHLRDGPGILIKYVMEIIGSSLSGGTAL
jgi:hypothetical protein